MWYFMSHNQKQTCFLFHHSSYLSTRSPSNWIPNKIISFGQIYACPKFSKGHLPRVTRFISFLTRLLRNVESSEIRQKPYSFHWKIIQSRPWRASLATHFNSIRSLYFFFRFQESALDVPVVLVGNKTDQSGDRMVSVEDGQRRSKEIGCVCFHEISVRESIEQV